MNPRKSRMLTHLRAQLYPKALSEEDAVDLLETRICSVCKFPKDLDDFPRDQRVPTGRSHRCLQCNRTKNKLYYSQHREKRRRYFRLWRATKWPSETVSSYSPAYYLAYREAFLHSAKTYQAKHPEVMQAINQRRRARKLQAPLNDFTHAQWLEIQAAQEHRCYYCKKRCKGKLTQDHLTPLLDGGSHTLHNVIGVCRSCNSRKGRKKPPIPVQPFLLTVASSRKAS